jgi:hypothetical protein
MVEELASMATVGELTLAVGRVPHISAGPEPELDTATSGPVQESAVC